MRNMTTIIATRVTTKGALPIITLSPEQQERRNALDMPELEREYTGYVEEDRAAAGASGMGAGAGNDSASNGSDSGNAAGSASAQQGASLPAPANMSFSDLDRNDDGKLSVAEWAIYAVGVDPTVKKGEDDQKPPYATADQLNRAADGFFAYDTDGDTYLQEGEFEQAKAGIAPAT